MSKFSFFDVVVETDWGFSLWLSRTIGLFVMIVEVNFEVFAVIVGSKTFFFEVLRSFSDGFWTVTILLSSSSSLSWLRSPSSSLWSSPWWSFEFGQIISSFLQGCGNYLDFFDHHPQFGKTCSIKCRSNVQSNVRSNIRLNIFFFQGGGKHI